MSSPESAPPSRGAVAAAEQDLRDPEFAELDALLAAIPEPLEPLDAVMLDGFLCGVLVQPVLPEVEDWLPYVFDAGGHRWGEAEPSHEQRRARALVLRRHAALNRAIAEVGGFDPCVLMPDEGDDVEAAGGDPIVAAVGPWVAGFEQALHLLPALVELDDPTVAAVLARLFRFLPDDAGDGTSAGQRERLQISLDDAIGELVGCVAELYELTLPLRYKVAPVRHAAPKVGRNDPCPCGSGRKYKHCHGATAVT
ncbi:MAG TPA: UPF0149 family protein [Caldimonas sp.]|jgi:uncharacterized protein